MSSTFNLIKTYIPYLSEFYWTSFMLKIFGEKSSVNLRTITGISAITAFSLLTGCQTLPSTMPKANHATKTPIDTSASNPLTARMPAIDWQGHIA